MAGDYDIESGRAGRWADDKYMRWGFIRKVYGILLTQLALTSAIAGVVAFVHPIHRSLSRFPWLPIIFAILALIILCPIFIYRQRHPINLILLALFTVFESLFIGSICAFTRGEIVLEALVLTVAITVGLTLFTFWGVRRGYDFSFLGPFLFASLIMLIVWGLIQAFLPIVPMLTAVYAMLGALVFSGYIVYDTYNLIERHSYDDYIWAALSLYIDIINLFLNLLQILRFTSR